MPSTIEQIMIHTDIIGGSVMGKGDKGNEQWPSPYSPLPQALNAACEFGINLGREVFRKLQIHGAQVPGPEKLGTGTSQMEKSSVLAALKKSRLQEAESQLH